jgi:hypothetical protein
MDVLKTQRVRFTLGYNIEGDRHNGRKPVHFDRGSNKLYKKNASPNLDRVGFRDLNTAMLAQEALEKELSHVSIHPEFVRGTSRIHRVEAEFIVSAIKIDDFMALRDKAEIAEASSKEDSDVNLSPAEKAFLKRQNVPFDGSLKAPIPELSDGFTATGLQYKLAPALFDLDIMDKDDVIDMHRHANSTQPYSYQSDNIIAIDILYKAIHGRWQREEQNDQPSSEYIWLISRSVYQDSKPINTNDFHAIVHQEVLEDLSVADKATMNNFKASGIAERIEDALKAPFSHKRQNNTYAPRVKHSRDEVTADSVSDSILGAADVRERFKLKREFADKAIDIRPVEINAAGIEISVEDMQLLKEYTKIMSKFRSDNDSYRGLAEQEFLEHYPKVADILSGVDALRDGRNDGFWAISRSATGKKATKKVEVPSRKHSLDRLLNDLDIESGKKPFQVMYCTVTFGPAIPEQDIDAEIFASLSEKFEGKGSAGSAMRAIGQDTGLLIEDQSDGPTGRD